MGWTSLVLAILFLTSIWRFLSAGPPAQSPRSQVKIAARRGRAGRAASLGACRALAAARSPANELIAVPGSKAWLGDDHGQADERPRRRVWVAGFAMQRHEVTWAEYCDCVLAGRCSPPGKSAGPGERLPVTGVSYSQAAAYCAFRGLRLPREEEWEKAAAGAQGRRYPWGDKADCSKANYGAYDGQGPCAGKNPGRVLPVASRPAGRSPYGLDDMAGNVWEWTRGRNGRPVLRGGSCCSLFLLPRVSNRLVLPGSYQDADIGFRCAGPLGSVSKARRGSGPQRTGKGR